MDSEDARSDELPNLEVSIKEITVMLTEEQGEMIKDLIYEEYVHGYPQYCMMVGIKTANFYSILKGNKACSLSFLNKLLSGIDYEATLTDPVIRIQAIQTGQIVVDVDSIVHEEESLSDEKEETDTTDSYS